MNKLYKFFIFFVLLFLFLLPVTVFADTSDTLREYELEEYMRTQGEGYQKPYTISELGTESIDPYSGGLSLRATDLTLPGKNGMDFVLARSYNNQAGRAYIEYENTTVLREVTYPAAYYNYVKDGVTQSVLVAFESEEELYAAWDSFRMGNNINLNIDAYQQEYLLYHKWMRQDGALVLTRDTTKACRRCI